MSDAAQAATTVPIGLDEQHGGEFGGANLLAQRLLNFVLLVTMLTSSIAFIEPSPHDGLMVVLLAACVAARVTFDRKLVPLLLLVIVWLIGGFFCMVQVGDQRNAIQYAGTSLYLGIAGVMFACLFCDGNLTRLRILRGAYILAALIATAAGFAGFFHLFPGASIFLTYDRVSATFKDPNVYGPFLVYPLVLLIMGFIIRGARPVGLAVAALLSVGLFLSFSRGAWMHFAVSIATAMTILMAVAPSPRMRYRIVLFGAATALAAGLLLIALTSIDSVRDIFFERAKAFQPYDLGPGGRFWDQQLALNVILDHPNGVGPFEFSRIFGGQQHDVYMQGFLVYGWLGGAAYLTLVAVTLIIGIRAVLLPAPWQEYLIAAYAAFVGEACEGFIVDTDHWRHFFLLLGLIWGLTAATINLHRRQARGLPVDDAAAASAGAVRAYPR